MDASQIDIIDPLVYERGGVPHEQFAWPCPVRFIPSPGAGEYT